MKNPKRMLMIWLFIIWMIFTFVVCDSEAEATVYYGKVVATEGKSIQVKGNDGRVSVFWWDIGPEWIPEVPFSVTG